MNSPTDDNDPGITDLPGQLRSALHQPPVPSSLKQRVEHTLLAEGLLAPRSRKRFWRSPAMAALAAGVAFFAVGIGVGAMRGRGDRGANPPPATSFALLLYEGSAGEEPADDVDEHRSWATALAHDGHSVSGEKLAPRALVTIGEKSWVAEPASGDAALQGFFLVSAQTEAEALAIARSSPHFRHGGRIVVRRIEPT